MRCMRPDFKYETRRGSGVVGLLLIPWVATYAHAQDGNRVYRNEEAGYSITAPAGWSADVASPRSAGQGVMREDEVLLEGELHKLTLREGGQAIWPGQFQVRVYDSADAASHDRWVAEWTAGDVWESGVRDTTVAGAPAARLARWNYDHLGTEIAVFRPGRIYLLMFDEQNGNDPDFERHQSEYRRIVASFRLLDP